MTASACSGSAIAFYWTDAKWSALLSEAASAHVQQGVSFFNDGFAVLVKSLETVDCCPVSLNLVFLSERIDVEDADMIGDFQDIFGGVLTNSGGPTQNSLWLHHAAKNDARRPE